MAIDYIKRIGVRNLIPARVQKKIVELLQVVGPVPVIFVITDFYRGLAHEHGDEAAREMFRLLTELESELVKRKWV